MRGPFWLPLLLGALIFPLLPGHPLTPLPGLPLGGPSLTAFAVVAILFFGWTPHQPARSDRYLLGALVALCLIKLGTQAASPDYGLRGNYYTRAPDGTISAQPERSLD